MPQPQPPRTLAVRDVADCEALPMRSQTYEITFAGRAGATVCAAFDDCQVMLGRGTTTLRAELPDQTAAMALLERIAGLGLELVELHLVAPPPGP
jgi:hypothetical protein